MGNWTQSVRRDALVLERGELDEREEARCPRIEVPDADREGEAGDRAHGLRRPTRSHGYRPRLRSRLSGLGQGEQEGEPAVAKGGDGRFRAKGLHPSSRAPPLNSAPEAIRSVQPRVPIRG